MSRIPSRHPRAAAPHAPAASKPAHAPAPIEKEVEARPTNWSRATGKPVGRSSTNTLTFRGGAVLSKPVINNIYFGDYWLTANGKGESKQNDAFSTDLFKSKHMSVLAQYGVGQGSFAGSTTLPGRPTNIAAADVERIVKAQIAAGTESKDPQTIHTVILPPGCVLTSPSGADSKQGLGGFHGSYADASGKPVYYAVIAYSDTQGNGINFDGKSIDAVNITESHEWMEAATDPDVNSPIAGRKLAWYNDAGGEIGDLAIRKLPLAQTFETVDGFKVQKEWSNLDGKFETIESDPNSPVVPPIGAKVFG